MRARRQSSWSTALSGQLTADCYPVRVTVGGESTGGLGNQESSSSRTIVLDWEPMVWEIISDLANGAPIPFLSAKFHNTLVESLVTIAVVAGEERVCLTGGCFPESVPDRTDSPSAT
jgi:hydrogenase maturation factor HypF (carbamoyltransferase family)